MDDDELEALGRLRRRELAEPEVAADARATASEREGALDAVFARLEAAPHASTSNEPSATIVRPSRWRAPGLVAAAIALAAMLVLWIARPSTQIDAQVPAYAITRVEGGAASVRSEPAGTALVLQSPADPINVVLTPKVAVRGELEVWIAVHDVDGRSVQRVDVTARVERSADGVVRLRGPLDAFVALSAGVWRLDVAIAKAGAGPRAVSSDSPAGLASVSSLRVTIAPG
jgi:hypothetical protein